MLRKNEIIDESGAFMKDFYIYIDENKLYCPVITIHSQTPLTYIVNHEAIEWNDEPFIAIDKQSTIELMKCYLQGEISIMYLLNQNAIESTIPEIKCDIINARNALKLHESNIAYFYKPSYINESDENYSMTFNIPDSYSLPTGMEFTFTEHCFNNTWLLTWDGDKWVGENIQAKSKAEDAIDAVKHWDQQGHFVVALEKNEFNDYIIKNWFNIDTTNDKTVFKQILEDKRTTITFDGLYDNNEHFDVARDGLPSLKSMLSLGGFNSAFDKHLESNYYHAQINVAINVEAKNDKLKKQIINSYINRMKELHMFVNIGGITNKFVCDLYITNDPLEEYTSGPQAYYIKLKTIKNVIQKLGAKFEASNITTKDITLHLNRKMLRPIEEINWDPTTNPFKYIIDQQFYTISPNPNAVTTLYTDYNITSSKIITADNITTMRSDLNIIANTQDVIVYDVDKITKRVDNFDVEMSDVKNRVSHLESKVKSLNIKTDIALILSVASTALSIGNTLELAGNYVSIGMGKFRNFINNGYTRLATTSGEASEVEMAAVDYSENLTPVPFENSRMTNSDGYIKLKSWIHAAHVKPKFSSLYADDNEESANNPQAMIVSYATLNDICIYYRDSLKPVFSVVCNKLDNFNNTIRDVPYKKDLQGMVKLSDFVDVGINNCTLPEDQSQNLLMITFEHPIYCGSLDLIVNFTSNNNKQNSYNLKIIFSPYDEPQLTGDEWVDGKGGVDIVGDNIAALTWTTFNMDEQSNVSYVIKSNNVNYKISERGIDDLVYRETTDDLDKRLKALEALKHEPPTIDMTEYPTVDEVNEALSNYVLKSDLNENYLKKSQLEEQFVNEDELAYELQSLATIDYVRDHYTTFTYNQNHYVDKTNLSVQRIEKNKRTLNVERHRWQEEGVETSFVEFHEGAHLIGYEDNHPDTRKFDIIFKTEKTTTQSNGQVVHWMTVPAKYDLQIIWNESTGAIADYNGTYSITITLAEVDDEHEVDDKLAMQSQIDKLQAKINELQTQIESSMVDEWKMFYHGFTKYTGDEVKLQMVLYPEDNHLIVFDRNDKSLMTGYEWLLIFDDDEKTHYIRFDYLKKFIILDEIYGLTDGYKNIIEDGQYPKISKTNLVRSNAYMNVQIYYKYSM